MKRKRHWSYTGEKRRLRVLRRDNYECQIRGPGCEGTATTVDHIHPKAWGGTEDESNLRAACWTCNQRKGARAVVSAVAVAPRPRPAFFSEHGFRRALLQNPSPRMLPKLTVVSDYSRKSGGT